MTLLKLIALSLAALALSACAPSQVLVSQQYVGSRVVRYTIEPSTESTEDSGRLFDLRVRVCDADSSGEDRDCKDSMLLKNIQPRSVY